MSQPPITTPRPPDLPDHEEHRPEEPGPPERLPSPAENRIDRRGNLAYKRGDLVIRPADKQGFKVVSTTPPISGEDDAETMIEVADHRRRIFMPASLIRNQVLSSKSQAER